MLSILCLPVMSHMASVWRLTAVSQYLPDPVPLIFTAGPAFLKHQSYVSLNHCNETTVGRIAQTILKSALN